MTKEERKQKKIAEEAEFKLVESVFMEAAQTVCETVAMLFKFARTRKKSQETFDKAMSDAAVAFKQLNLTSMKNFIMEFFEFAHVQAAKKRKKLGYPTIKLAYQDCLETPNPKEPMKYVRAMFNRDVVLPEPPIIHREASREAVELYTAESMQHMVRISHNVLEGMLQMLLKFAESRKRVRSKNFLDIELYKATVAYKQVCRDNQSQYAMDFVNYLQGEMIKNVIKRGEPTSVVCGKTVPGKIDLDEIFDDMVKEHLAKQPLPKYVNQVVPNVSPVNPMIINPKLEEKQ